MRRHEFNAEQRTGAGTRINAGAEVNARNDSGDAPLHDALYLLCDYPTENAIHLETIANLVTAGAEISTRSQEGYTPLQIAGGSTFPRIVAILVKAGADVSAGDGLGATPFDWAVGARNKPMERQFSRADELKDQAQEEYLRNLEEIVFLFKTAVGENTITH